MNEAFCPSQLGERRIQNVRCIVMNLGTASKTAFSCAQGLSETSRKNIDRSASRDYLRSLLFCSFSLSSDKAGVLLVRCTNCDLRTLKVSVAWFAREVCDVNRKPHACLGVAVPLLVGSFTNNIFASKHSQTTNITVRASTVSTKTVYSPR